MSGLCCGTRWRHAAPGIMVVVALLISLLPDAVAARVVSCKKDPIVYLSNGKTVKIVETIYTSADKVTEIVYTVRVPAGVKPTKIVFTGGASVSANEKILIFDDQQPTRYSTTVHVTTTHDGVSVIGQTTIGKTSAKFSGYNGQDLTIPTLTVK
jgi:hypothetical protein